MIVEDRTEEARCDSISALAKAMEEVSKFGYIVNFEIFSHFGDYKEYKSIYKVNHNIDELNNIRKNK